MLDQGTLKLPINSNTNSMDPLIKKNAHIEICKIQKLSIGDLVVAINISNGIIICHRVIKIIKDEIITQGDNNKESDAIKPINDLIGKVIAIHYEKHEFSINLRSLQAVILGSIIGLIKRIKILSDAKNLAITRNIAKLYYTKKQYALFGGEQFELSFSEQLFLKLLRSYLDNDVNNYCKINVDAKITSLAEKHKTEFLIPFIKNEKFAPSNFEISWHLECVALLFDVFKNNHIAFSLTKGIYLSQVIYKNINISEFHDLEILVFYEQYNQVRELMLKSGYVVGDWDKMHRSVRTENHPIFSKNETKYFAVPYIISKKSIYSNDYIKISVNVNLNLSHHQIHRIRSNINLKTLINTHYPVFSEHYCLIYLCQYLFRSANSLVYLRKNERIIAKNIADIYYFITCFHLRIDIDGLIYEANELNLLEDLYFSMYYVECVFKCALASEIMLKIPINGDKLFVDRFGDKRKIQWNIDVWERLFCDNIFDLIKPNLSNSEIQESYNFYYFV